MVDRTNISKGTEENHGNTRLPYGLAKRVGLETTGLTPRQVWDKLKGRGIFPPWENKGESEKKIENSKDEHVLKDFFDKEKVEPQVTNFFTEQKVNTNGLNFMNDGGASVKSFEQSKYKLRHEESAVFDINGNKIFEKKGIANKVSFYPSEFVHFKDNIFSHNHPDHNSVLSPQDIEFWAKRQSKAARMVDADGKTMTITAEKNVDRNGFVETYVELFSEAHEVGVKALRDEKVSIRYPDRQNLKANYMQHYDTYNQAVKNFLKPKLKTAGQRYNVTVEWEE